MVSRLVEINEFLHESGFCWTAELGQDIQYGESETGTRKSELRLFEDGVELKPASAAHEFIRKTGCGAFSHWSDKLYFSASDNSNPQVNKKKYHVLANLKSQSEVGGGKAPSGHLPVNYNKVAVDDNKIAMDVDYAINCALSYVNALPGGKSALKDKSVLELGPGPSFASTLVLKAWGARSIAVADRFLSGFNSSYHPALYRELAQKLQELDASSDVSCLIQCAEKGHLTHLIDAHEMPLEELVETFQNIDITLSNAVFEHLYDPLRAINALYSIMAEDGIGLHQVDFRDHRDFSRPLEYLLLDEMSFLRLFDSCHGECGGRTRPFQMHDMFLNVGFKAVKFNVNMEADPDYLGDLMSRLGAINGNLYGKVDKEILRPISGQFVVQK